MPRPNQIWPISRIREMILTNDVVLERSIVEIYNRQTSGEQTIGATVEHNKIGFTGVDAEILSGFATWIQSHRRPEGQRLSVRQKEIARHKMPKYARQLSEIAEQRHKEKLYSRYVGEKLQTCGECDGTTISTDGYGPVRCESCV
jgi:hypothetical protein